LNSKISKCLKWLTKKISKRGVLFIGLSLQTIGVIVSGIEKVNVFENPGFFSLIGLAIFGIGMGFVTIPVMPEILDSIEEDPSFVYYDEQHLYNTCSGYFSVC
jgi:hypothetical protein